MKLQSGNRPGGHSVGFLNISPQDGADAFTAAAIMIALVSGVTIIFSGPFSKKKAGKEKATAQPVEVPKPAMRDMAVGPDEEFLEDLEQVTDAKLEQILSESGVEKIEQAAKKVRSRSGSKSQIDVDRI